MIVSKKFYTQLQNSYDIRMAETLVHTVQSTFPKRCRIMGEEHVKAVIIHCQKQLHPYIHYSKEELRRYVELAFYLGTRFDEDPLYPWVQEILATQDALGLKLKKLEEKFSYFMEKTVKNDFSLMIQALERFIAVSKQEILAIKTYEELVSIYASIYPERMQCIGQKHFLAIIRTHDHTIKEQNIFAPMGYYLYTAIIFLLGSYASNDPLYGWVSKYLNAPYISQEEKLDVLYTITIKRSKKELKELYTLTKEIDT